MKIKTFSLGVSESNSTRICIEVKEDLLKIFVFNVRANKWQLDDLAVIQTQGGSDQQIQDQLKTILNANKAPHAEVTLILTRNLLFVRYLKLPPGKISEIQQMVHFQLDKHLPYDADEVVYDLIPVSMANEYSKVLLVAAAKKTINKYLQIINAVGAKPKEILFAPQLLQEISRSGGVSGSSDETVLLVDFDWHMASVLILRGTQLLITRSISLNYDQNEEDFLRQLVGELDISLSSIKKEDSTFAITKIVLSGNLEHAAFCERELHEYFQVPVKTVPFENNSHVKLANPQKLKEKIKKLRISVSTPLAIASGVKYVDLLPPDIRSEIQKKTKGQQRSALMIVGGILLVMLYLCGWAYLHFKQSRLSYYSTSLTSNQQTSSGLTNLIQKLGSIQEFEKDRLLGLDVYAELYKTVPQDVILKSVGFDMNGEVKIRGVASDNSRVTDLLIALQKSAVFTREELISSRQRSSRRENVVEFSIQCYVKN